MIQSDDLREQIDIIENLIRFITKELRSMPHSERRGSEELQALLDDMYEVLDRHGYRGIIKLVGEVDPENVESGSAAWAHVPPGDYYLFKK